MQSFAELSLSAPIARAITDLGYEKPSPIQAETLPILLGEPTDFLGLAATGTGKTAAFSIPMLEKIDPSVRAVQALILCPTRELALQVCGQVALLGKHKGVRPVAVYGGAPYGEQIAGLRQGAQIVVGTPGRVMDHLDKGTLRLDNLSILVLDEADEMISMGFKDELEKILSSVPRESSNIWLFSATMSREVRRVADEYLRKPKQVQVNRTEMLPSTVEQYYYPTQENDKPEVLCKLIEAAESFYGLIFCQTKSLVVDLTQFLHERGYKVDSLHGDKDQNSRERTMKAFRDHKVEILVCTDVASRGLDVKDITHVINYSLPRELDNYVHRIGRTARSGKTGIAMNLVTPSHRRLIFQIENMTKTRMLEGRIPSRREIGARKVNKVIEAFQAQSFHTRAVEVMNEEWKALLATMTSEEVAGRFLTLMQPDIFNERDNSKKVAQQSAAAAANTHVVKPANMVRAVNQFASAGPSTRPSSRPSVSVTPVAPMSAAPVAAVAAPKKAAAKKVAAPVVESKVETAGEISNEESAMIDDVPMASAEIVAEISAANHEAVEATEVLAESAVIARASVSAVDADDEEDFISDDESDDESDEDYADDDSDDESDEIRADADGGILGNILDAIGESDADDADDDAQPVKKAKTTKSKVEVEAEFGEIEAAAKPAGGVNREDRRRQLLAGETRAPRRERGERPAFAGREERPRSAGGPSAGRPSFGGGSGDSRPSFGGGGAREERPRSFGGARSGGPGAGRPSFGGGAGDSRPSFGGGGGFGGSRDERPRSFGGGRPSGPSSGGPSSGPSRFNGGGREERPRFGGRDAAPAYDRSNTNPRGPRFGRSEDTPSRGFSGERSFGGGGGGGERRATPYSAGGIPREKREFTPNAERPSAPPARRLPKEGNGEVELNRKARRALKFGTVSEAMPAHNQAD